MSETTQTHNYGETLTAMFEVLIPMITPRIEEMVDKKFAALVENIRTLDLIHNETRAQMEEIITECLLNHERDFSHLDSSEVATIVREETDTSTAVHEHEQNTDHLDRDDVETIVRDVLDSVELRLVVNP